MNTPVLDNREAIEDFVDEALESLADLPAKLDAYRSNPREDEPVHAVFRAVHSIKGCAAFLDMGAIRSFAHGLENTLDEVRNAKVALSGELAREFVAGFDVLDGMLQAAGSGSIATDLSAEQRQLLARVEQLAGKSRLSRPRAETLCGELLSIADCVAQNGVPEPSELSARLRSLVAEYTDTDTDADAPDPGEDAVERSVVAPDELLAARFLLESDDISQTVLPVIEGVLACAEQGHPEEAEAELAGKIAALAERLAAAGRSDAAEVLRAAGRDLEIMCSSPLDLDSNLLQIVWEQVSPVLIELKHPEDESAPGSAEESNTDAAASATNQAPASGRSDRCRFVRVREQRLDEFLEHVSRLFITAELFKDVQSRMAESGQLSELAEEVRQINVELNAQSTALQQSVMSLRRVAVSGLFSKFPRMARTLASQLGKEIAVHTSGDETEVDKMLAEDLDAPLTHLIRNVVDHGIELPDERSAAGKSTCGNLWLRAQETKTHICIAIQDDGRGIDPRDLRAKAVEKGVLSQPQADALSDDEAVDLIFHPGFSTAEAVSEVSGRGVGMDVVRTTLEKHNGEVTVESHLGAGTTVRMVLPIRQATLVIDGLMVSEGDGRFVIPFENIREILEVDRSKLHPVQGRMMIRVRQEVYEATPLRDILALQSPDLPENTQATGVLVQSKQGAFCLLVDRVQGHRQVVVNSLKEAVPEADKMAGVAQLGGGRLALVLDIAEIIRRRT